MFYSWLDLIPSFLNLDFFRNRVYQTIDLDEFLSMGWVLSPMKFCFLYFYFMMNKIWCAVDE